MISEDAENTHEARALDFANLGMQFQAEGDHRAALQSWLDALDYAERHLPDKKIIFWIRSGLGDSLLRVGDYRGALKMAASALEYCASVRAPLAALTMAQAYLRLGDVVRGRDYMRQACELKGERVFEVLCPADRDALRLDGPEGAC